MLTDQDKINLINIRLEKLINSKKQILDLINQYDASLDMSSESIKQTMIKVELQINALLSEIEVLTNNG
jgi:hypothetical protein